MPKLSLQGLLYINTSSVIHDLFINQHIYCYIIILLLSLNSMDMCASDPRPPASQLTTNWSVCIYSTVSKSISMGPGGRQRKLSWSLNSSHYVFKNLYLSVHLCNYYGMNWINIFVFVLSWVSLTVWASQWFYATTVLLLLRSVVGSNISMRYELKARLVSRVISFSSRCRCLSLSRLVARCLMNAFFFRLASLLMAVVIQS